MYICVCLHIYTYIYIYIYIYQYQYHVPNLQTGMERKPAGGGLAYSFTVTITVYITILYYISISSKSLRRPAFFSLAAEPRSRGSAARGFCGDLARPRARRAFVYTDVLTVVCRQPTLQKIVTRQSLFSCTCSCLFQVTLWRVGCRTCCGWRIYSIYIYIYIYIHTYIHTYIHIDTLTQVVASRREA